MVFAYRSRITMQVPVVHTCYSEVGRGKGTALRCDKAHVAPECLNGEPPCGQDKDMAFLSSSLDTKACRDEFPKV